MAGELYDAGSGGDPPWISVSDLTESLTCQMLRHPWLLTCQMLRHPMRSSLHGIPHLQQTAEGRHPYGREHVDQSNICHMLTCMLRGVALPETAPAQLQHAPGRGRATIAQTMDRGAPFECTNAN
eukprot:12044135-Karenia_brevis.AAC.1